MTKPDTKVGNIATSQVRLNGEELKTQNLFFVAFSLEKLKGFVHCTNKHVCKYNEKNIFCFFATYGTGNKHIYTIFRQQNVN